MTEKKKVLMTKSEFARKTGVTKGRVSQLIKEGTLRETKGGRLDFKESIARIKANRDPRRSSKIVPDEEEEGITQGLRRARAVREAWSAKTAELEYKTKSRAMIDAMEVKSKLFESWRMLKDAFENLPNRLAPVFAGETDIEKIRVELKKEINAAIQDFKRGVSRIVVFE